MRHTSKSSSETDSTASLYEQAFRNETRPHSERCNKQAPENAKALVLDLDGTLLSHGSVLPPGARETMESIQATGRQVILASGRPPRSVLDIQQKLGLAGPVIALNGAWIGDRFRSYHEYALPSDVINDFLPALEPAGSVMFLYTRTRWLSSSLSDPLTQHEASMVGYQPDGLIGSNALADELPLKIGLLGPATSVSHLRTLMQTDRCIASFTHPSILEIAAICPLDPESQNPVSKRSAVQTVMALNNLTLRDVLALGDGENDALLLASAGHGVTFPNAHERALYCADAVIQRHPTETVLPYLRKIWGIS